MRPLLGTYVEIGAQGFGGVEAIDSAFAVIEQAHHLWSFQSPDSELSQLNALPGRCMPLQRITLRLLKLATAMMRRSQSAFDCTVGGLLVDKGVLPDHGGPASLARGHVDDIEIGSTWARLHRPIRLTLDGIAKGYAIDLAIIALQKNGVQAGWINAGGDVRVFGDLTLTMQRRELDGAFSALGGLRDAAMASSRVPIESQVSDDQFPAYLVGSNGQPASGVWTVLARSAWRADALTKVAANTPVNTRVEVIRQLGGCLIITDVEQQSK